MGEEWERRPRKNSTSRLWSSRREVREPCRNQEIHSLSWNFPREGLVSIPFKQNEDSVTWEVPAGKKDVLQSVETGGGGRRSASQPPCCVSSERGGQPGAISLPNISMQTFHLPPLQTTRRQPSLGTTQQPAWETRLATAPEAGHASVTPATGDKTAARRHSTEGDSLRPPKGQAPMPVGQPALPASPPSGDRPETPPPLSSRCEILPQVCLWRLRRGRICTFLASC